MWSVCLISFRFVMCWLHDISFVMPVIPPTPLWLLDTIPGHGLPLLGFMITLTGQTTLGRTPLDESSAHRRDPYLTTHNTNNRQTSMPPARFEPAFPAIERPQIHSLRRLGYRDRHCMIMYCYYLTFITIIIIIVVVVIEV